MCLHNHKLVFTRKTRALRVLSLLFLKLPTILWLGNKSAKKRLPMWNIGLCFTHHYKCPHAHKQWFPLTYDQQFELMAWWERSKYERHTTTHQNLARRDLSSLLGLYNHFLREFIGPPVVAGEYKNVSITMYILLNSMNFFFSSLISFHLFSSPIILRSR